MLKNDNNYYDTWSVAMVTTFERLHTPTIWNCRYGIEGITYSIINVGCSVLCGKRKNCLMYSANHGRCLQFNHKLGLSETFDFMLSCMIQSTNFFHFS